MENRKTGNPMEHTANVKKEFRALIDHLRSDIEKINDPQGKALFEVTAEVLIGLEKHLQIMRKRKNRHGKSNLLLKLKKGVAILRKQPFQLIIL
jgi:hypothetical protein